MTQPLFLVRVWPVVQSSRRAERQTMEPNPIYASGTAGDAIVQKGRTSLEKAAIDFECRNDRGTSGVRRDLIKTRSRAQYEAQVPSREGAGRAEPLHALDAVQGHAGSPGDPHGAGSRAFQSGQQRGEQRFEVRVREPGPIRHGPAEDDGNGGRPRTARTAEQADEEAHQRGDRPHVVHVPAHQPSFVRLQPFDQGLDFLNTDRGLASNT